MEEMHFVYINANARIGAHSISNVSHSDSHIQGICQSAHSIRTFRKDRILQEFSSADEAQLSCQSFLPENYLHLTKVIKPKTLTFDVCFTGFKKSDKERLIEVAEANSLTVRSSVTQNLQMLCCGYNAGPSKVNAARMKGTIVIDEESFVHFIETGEIPDA
ncbi:hypothetical protein I5398_22500 [Citrobacter freundii]|uniref:hypothetical protein n=1 Tax=Enterobacteriaceae TaxID=543 RepID=UPI0004454FAC|nr:MULTISPECIES: hypothetical protein [Enterobacteriaceae]EAO4365570.1 hypothetical protein [Salmonella enterica subsp. enterica serovar Bere]QZS46317.1 hypothetical protein K6966_17805 [Enterobacter cloacae complex sp.]HBV1560623.1 hypothetical protein [Escherichia coli]ECE0997081.1 hypothetical protein [Salmonella enterica subsp. enterica serovar Bere]EDT7274134.1 hypothetical protein [Salmonella enterica subsp. enterica serovar Bere]